MPPTTSTIREEPALALQRLQQHLAGVPHRVIACSGGIDSLLLATIAYREAPEQTTIAHTISPAVPKEATERLKAWGKTEQWQIELVSSAEFASEDYLSNPVNRCYFCKSNLYLALEPLAAIGDRQATIMSGANTDDLGEYRPGLIAAAERDVQHPYVDTQIDKQTIRGIARFLDLPFAELPASPCLASRLYTGTRVTAERLRTIEAAEALLRSQTGLPVIRCRIREGEMLVEVPQEDRDKITSALLERCRRLAEEQGLALNSVELDPHPYSPGRAFVQD